MPTEQQSGQHTQQSQQEPSLGQLYVGQPQQTQLPQFSQSLVDEAMLNLEPMTAENDQEILEALIGLSNQQQLSDFSPGQPMQLGEPVLGEPQPDQSQFQQSQSAPARQTNPAPQPVADDLLIPFLPPVPPRPLSPEQQIAYGRQVHNYFLFVQLLAMPQFRPLQKNPRIRALCSDFSRFKDLHSLIEELWQACDGGQRIDFRQLTGGWLTPSREEQAALHIKRREVYVGMLHSFESAMGLRAYLEANTMTLPRLHPCYIPFGGIEIQGYLTINFKDNTSSSFNVDPVDRRHSDSILSGIALQYCHHSTALRNTMFAISALHLRSRGKAVREDVTRDWVVTATAQFNTDMNIAEPEQFPHLLVTSLFMTAVSSDNFRLPENKGALYILSWMRVWRGIGTMIERLTIEGLIKSGLSKLFYRPPLNLEQAVEHVPTCLRGLAQHFAPQDQNVQHIKVYQESVNYIGSLYQHLKEGLSPMMRLRIITWFTFLPTRFIYLSATRDWRCLIIIAHYAVFLKLTIRVWWMQNVGQQTIEDILAHFGPDAHEEALRVPRAAVGIDDVESLGRLLTRNPEWVQQPCGWSSEEMLFDNIRDDYVDDAGRIVVPGNPDIVYDRNAPEGVSRAVWNRER